MFPFSVLNAHMPASAWNVPWSSPGRIPPPLFVPLCLQPHSSLSCYPVCVACLSASTAIIMQLPPAEDPLRARHCSRGVTLMNSFQPQTTHLTVEEGEAYRIKSIGPKSYSWEVGWSASECSQLTPVPLSVPMASQGCMVLACWRAQQMLQKWANLWMGLSACLLTKRFWEASQNGCEGAYNEKAISTYSLLL